MKKQGGGVGRTKDRTRQPRQCVCALNKSVLVVRNGDMDDER